MKDAPRAFSIKLWPITTGPELGLTTSFHDQELEYLHESVSGSAALNLTGVICKHVDDIKVAGLT